MHANGMRLLKLINDLLDLVRLESGVMVVKANPLEVLGFRQGFDRSSARQVADGQTPELETFVDPELGAVLARSRQAGKNRAEPRVQCAQIHAGRRHGGIARGKTRRELWC